MPLQNLDQLPELHSQRSLHLTRHRLSPPIASFDSSPDTRTRPRHHFRGGAISTPQSAFILDEQQGGAETEVRIRSLTVNPEFEIIVTGLSGRAPHLPRLPTHQEYLQQVRALVGRIRDSLLNPNTPDLQNRAGAAVTSLQNNPSSLQIIQAMEGESGTPRRDTFRFGREGWATVEPESAADQRPATISGSDFVVPPSTLNLFQSVDLFAPPPPRPSARACVAEIRQHISFYQRHLQMTLNDLAERRRSGLDTPRGQIFSFSMESSRVDQLLNIVRLEEREMLAHAAGVVIRTRRDLPPSGEESDDTPDSSVEENALADAYEMAFGSDPRFPEEDSSSDSEMREPEGWANLELVMTDDYPQEVRFRIGSQEVVYPVEEVENWILDAQRHRAPDSLRRDNRRILHTFEVPELPISSETHWRNIRAANRLGEYADEISSLLDARDEISDFNDAGNGDVITRAGPLILDPVIDGIDGNDEDDDADGDDSEGDADMADRESEEGDDADDEDSETSSRGRTIYPFPPHPFRDWLRLHSYFMYGCRGNVFEVTAQLNRAFGFQPPITSDEVCDSLNGESAISHHHFVEVFLPGESGIEQRAVMRWEQHRNDGTDDDIYHGTQPIVEADVDSDEYATPAVPGDMPDEWGREQDIAMLLWLVQGDVQFGVIVQFCRSLLGVDHLSDDLVDFLGIRFAQVRYLGITESEFARAVGRHSFA